jgi:hypothetical protein
MIQIMAKGFDALNIPSMERGTEKNPYRPRSHEAFRTPKLMTHDLQKFTGIAPPDMRLSYSPAYLSSLNLICLDLP